MSKTTLNRLVQRVRRNVPVFAALGDETRLMLLIRLGDGQWLSITQLTEGTTVTRQSITKHLRILQDAGLVREMRQGREALFQIQPRSLDQAKDSLDVISRQWDLALARLKSFVEE